MNCFRRCPRSLVGRPRVVAGAVLQRFARHASRDEVRAHRLDLDSAEWLAGLAWRRPPCKHGWTPVPPAAKDPDGAASATDSPSQSLAELVLPAPDRERAQGLLPHERDRNLRQEECPTPRGRPPPQSSADRDRSPLL